MTAAASTRPAQPGASPRSDRSPRAVTAAQAGVAVWPGGAVEGGNEEHDDASSVRAAKFRLPAAAERRLKRLIARSERGLLTPEELVEYQALAQEVLRLDAARAEALAESARRRGKSAQVREGGNPRRRRPGWRMRRSRVRSGDRSATAPATFANTAGIPPAIRASVRLRACPAPGARRGEHGGGTGLGVPGMQRP